MRPPMKITRNPIGVLTEIPANVHKVPKIIDAMMILIMLELVYHSFIESQQEQPLF